MEERSKPDIMARPSLCFLVTWWHGLMWRGGEGLQCLPAPYANIRIMTTQSMDQMCDCIMPHL